MVEKIYNHDDVERYVVRHVRKTYRPQKALTILRLRREAKQGIEGSLRRLEDVIARN